MFVYKAELRGNTGGDESESSDPLWQDKDTAVRLKLVFIFAAVVF